MANLAEDWDEWTKFELDMMLTAVDWYFSPANDKQGVNAGLLPFIAKEKVLTAVEAYKKIFVWGAANENYPQWNLLVAKLRHGLAKDEKP